MELHQRQQFDFFLQTATERFIERLQQRFRGAEGALEQLRTDPNGQGVWLEGFTQAVFEDFLLNNLPGACFILQSLAKRPVDATTMTLSGNVESAMQSLASTLFRELLRQKSLEMLEQLSGYQPVQLGDH